MISGYLTGKCIQNIDTSCQSPAQNPCLIDCVATRPTELCTGFCEVLVVEPRVSHTQNLWVFGRAHIESLVLGVTSRNILTAPVPPLC